MSILVKNTFFKDGIFVVCNHEFHNYHIFKGGILNHMTTL